MCPCRASTDKTSLVTRTMRSSVCISCRGSSKRARYVFTSAQSEVRASQRRKSFNVAAGRGRPCAFAKSHIVSGGMAPSKCRCSSIIGRLESSIFISPFFHCTGRGAFRVKPVFPEYFCGGLFFRLYGVDRKVESMYNKRVSSDTDFIEIHKMEEPK